MFWSLLSVCPHLPVLQCSKISQTGKKKKKIVLLSKRPQQDNNYLTHHNPSFSKLLKVPNSPGSWDSSGQAVLQGHNIDNLYTLYLSVSGRLVLQLYPRQPKDTERALDFLYPTVPNKAECFCNNILTCQLNDKWAVSVGSRKRKTIMKMRWLNGAGLTHPLGEG